MIGQKFKFVVFIVFTCIFILILIVVQQLPLKPLHCKEIFLSENFLLKMASVKVVTVTSSIKDFHVYRRSPGIGEKLKCVLEAINRYSNTAIKVVGEANEIIGYIPDGLSKVVAPALKKRNRAFS